MVKKVGHLLEVVTLQLDNGTVLLVLNDNAVAVQRLLQVLQDLLVVKDRRHALHKRVALAAVTLLLTDVDLLPRHGGLALGLKNK